MRYHDFHLAGYAVTDFGRTVSLCLVYDYPGVKKEESKIEFTDVAAYHFIHTGGAIITEIEEEKLGNLLSKIGGKLVEWWHLHGGYVLWDDDPVAYGSKLQKEGYRAWTIDSAIGFEGFVIAKFVKEMAPNQSADSTSSAGTSAAGQPRVPASAASRL
jgi:hypothetical protein